MAQNYDVTLKTLLRESAGRAILAATGLRVTRWLNVELPKVGNPRLDMLGETADGTLVHLELQVSNDPDMPLRMAEYALAIYRIYRKFARQIVIYAGDADLRMPARLEGRQFSFAYEVIDLRDLDGEALLASDNVGDNVLAILTRLRDRRTAIDEILRKIATLDEFQREEALEGITKMATLIDIILNNKVLGREYKRGLADGKLEGKLEGELEVLRRQIAKRFGSVPQWAEERIASQSAEALQELGVRLLDASSLEDLLG